MQHASHWNAVENCGRASQFILLHSDTSLKRSLKCRESGRCLKQRDTGQGTHRDASLTIIW